MVRWFATASLTLLLLGSSAVAHAQVCRPITGEISTTQDVSGTCQSVLGICFTGTLRTNSALRGETSFTVYSAMYSASADPTNSTNLIYTGQLSVVHPNGTIIVFETQGVIDTLTGAFVETDRSTDATLTITGVTNATLSSFTGTVTGETCAAPVPTR
jgi:hypothetical protein